jgi:DNA gyrase subunit B
MPEAILAGYVYISRPPLYKVKERNHSEYIINNKKLKNYFYKRFLINLTNNPQFTQEKYFDLLKYQEIVKLFFKDINHVFVSRLLMAGILDVYKSTKTIEEVNKNFFSSDNSEVHLSIKSHDANDLKVYLEYQSFYTRYNNNIVFTKEFVEKISLCLESIKSFFPMKIAVKNDIKTFDEPLLMLDLIENLIRNEVYLQRYKGLGEMNPEELSETCLEQDKRIIEQVLFDPEKIEETDNIIQVLLGENVDVRREYIMDSALNFDQDMEDYYNKDYL